MTMMYDVRENLRYTEDHEWILMVDGKIRFGMSDYAQHELGDVVYIDLPAIGTHVNIGDEIGAMESVKSIEPIYAPVSGTILDVNPQLSERADIINESPYDDGWMAVIEIDNPSEIEGFLDADTYKKKIEQ